MVVLAAFGDNRSPSLPGSRWPLDGPVDVGRGPPHRSTGAVRGLRRSSGIASRPRPARRGFSRLRGRPDHRRRTGLGRDLDVLAGSAARRTISRIGSRSSPSWWRLADRERPRRARSSPGLPTSRRRCGGWRRWSPEERRRRSCSKPCASRSPGCSRRRRGAHTLRARRHGDGARRLDARRRLRGTWRATIRTRGHRVRAGLRDAPARADRQLRRATGVAAAAAREMGWRSSVGAPITVQGRPLGRAGGRLDERRRRCPSTPSGGWWSSPSSWRRPSPTPRAARSSRGSPTSRRRCGASPPWWRRAPRPAEVFEAVSAEVARLVHADAATLSRYGPDGTVDRRSAAWTRSGRRYHVPDRRSPRPRGGGPAPPGVLETGRPARIDRPARRTPMRPRRGRAARSAVGRRADHRRGPPVGRDGRRLDERRGRSRRHRGPAGASSPSSSRRRSRTPRAAPSSRPRGRASSPPPTRPGGGSSATCTTAPSSSCVSLALELRGGAGRGAA